MKDLGAKKRNSWTCERLQDLQEKIEAAGKTKEQFVALQQSDTSYSRQRLQQMKKQTANDLLEDNRIKRRHLGAGPAVKKNVIVNVIFLPTQHRGNAIFCTQKTPKAEDQKNKNTHYQRAHVHNIKTISYGSSTPEHVRELSFMRSIDDKAYLKPGTSRGFSKTRNSLILTMSTELKAPKIRQARKSNAHHTLNSLHF